MSALNCILAVQNTCDGDRNPNLRHKYNLEDMILFGTIADLGDKNVAEIKFFEIQ
jgi:hypothetical protein